jgi:hypothetical protein
LTHREKPVTNVLLFHIQLVLLRHGKNCSTRRIAGHCSTGARYSAETIVTGAVLPVWKQLGALAGAGRGGGHMGAEFSKVGGGLYKKLTYSLKARLVTRPLIL